MTELSRIAMQLFNVPMLIEPAKAEIIVCALHERLGVTQFDRIDGTTLGAAEMRAQSEDALSQPRRNNVVPVVEGVAVIEVSGTLVHKYGYLDPYSGMTGYDGITRKLRAAMADPEVQAIWFDIDSPGGSVAGLFTLAEEIALNTKSEGGKPIWAYVNEQATSAAYALACVCDKVFAPEEGVSGSIGAICMHVDLTAAIAEEGIKVRMFRSADRKARGGPYEDLDEATATKLQNWVDTTGQRFAKLVAMGRAIPVKDVVATNADWFTSQDALRLKLIDGIMSEADAWAKLQRSIKRSR